jgi:ABC-type transport system involved in multi-copper enzyme maturation permease subunit
MACPLCGGHAEPSTRRTDPRRPPELTLVGGGNKDASIAYGHGLTVAAIYAVVAIVAASITFARRDVMAWGLT